MAGRGGERAVGWVWRGGGISATGEAVQVALQVALQATLQATLQERTSDWALQASHATLQRRYSDVTATLLVQRRYSDVAATLQRTSDWAVEPRLTILSR